MEYPAKKIPRKLERLARNEDLAYHIAEPGKRYDSFRRLYIDCDILLELYPLSDQKKFELRVKQGLYSAQMDKSDAILQNRAKRSYGPFCVVTHDHIGAICEDREAIQANARKMFRNIAGYDFAQIKPEVKTKSA